MTCNFTGCVELYSTRVIITKALKKLIYGHIHWKFILFDANINSTGHNFSQQIGLLIRHTEFNCKESRGLEKHSDTNRCHCRRVAAVRATSGARNWS